MQLTSSYSPYTAYQAPSSKLQADKTAFGNPEPKPEPKVTKLPRGKAPEPAPEIKTTTNIPTGGRIRRAPGADGYNSDADAYDPDA